MYDPLEYLRYTMIDPKAHWNRVYSSKQSTEVSWYQPHLRTSLDLIGRAGAGPDDRIIDVGGGASTLVDDLLERGFKDLTVLDISSGALEVSKARLGDRARLVHWIGEDVLHAQLDSGKYRLWHDRAVLHFLTNAVDRQAYIGQVRNALLPGGFVIIGAFSLDGPSKCSGLETFRYSPESLLAEFGSGFRTQVTRRELHRTPSGAVQDFLYSLLSFDG